MSTSFRPIPDIPFNQLFDGRLDKFGVREKAERDPTARIRSLVGSDGVLEAYKNDDGTSFFKRRSFTPFPWSVLDALTEEFEAERRLSSLGGLRRTQIHRPEQIAGSAAVRHREARTADNVACGRFAGASRAVSDSQSISEIETQLSDLRGARPRQ